MKQPVNEIVRQLRALPGPARQHGLQLLIGAPVDLDHPDARQVLHDRALLVTALGRESVWPPRGVR